MTTILDKLPRAHTRNPWALDMAPQGMPGYCVTCRLLHSPSRVAIGLSVGYKTWPPIGWHHLCDWLAVLKIDWDCPVPHCIMGSRDQWDFQLFFRPQWQFLCIGPTTGNCLPLGLCKGTVKESNATCDTSLISASGIAITTRLRSY